MASILTISTHGTESNKILVFVAILNSILLILSTAIASTGKLESMTLSNAVTVQVMAILSFCLLRKKVDNLDSEVTDHKARPSRGCTPKPILTRSPGLLAVGWVLPAGFGLIVSSRQPLCLPTSSSQSWWQKGYVCRLHRLMVGLSVAMLIASCALFYYLERLDRYRRLTLAEKETGRLLKDVSPFDASGKSRRLPWEDQLYLIPETHVVEIEREQWLQRRNSLSSRRAIYPQHQRTYMQQRCNRTRSSPSRLHSLRENSELSLVDMRSDHTTSTLGGFSASSSNSSYNSSLGNSVTDSCTSVSMQSQSPIDCMGRSSTQPWTLSTQSSSLDELGHQERIPSPPPPAWCPSSLKQMPLSCDPTIRALSAGRLGDGRRSTANFDQTHAKGLLNTQLSGMLIRAQTAPASAIVHTTTRTPRPTRAVREGKTTRSISETAMSSAATSKCSMTPTAPHTAQMQPYPPNVRSIQRPSPTRIPSRNIHPAYRYQRRSPYHVMPPPTRSGCELGVLRDRTCDSAFETNKKVSYNARRKPSQASSVYSTQSCGAKDS